MVLKDEQLTVDKNVFVYMATTAKTNCYGFILLYHASHLRQKEYRRPQTGNHGSVRCNTGFSCILYLCVIQLTFLDELQYMEKITLPFVHAQIVHSSPCIERPFSEINSQMGPLPVRLSPDLPQRCSRSPQYLDQEQGALTSIL